MARLIHSSMKQHPILDGFLSASSMTACLMIVLSLGYAMTIHRMTIHRMILFGAVRTRPMMYEVILRGGVLRDPCLKNHELDYDKLREAQFVSSLLDSDKIRPKAEPPVDVCRLRANFVANGLILVVPIAHTVCDGRGITEVLSVFAKHFRHRSNIEFISSEENAHTKQFYKADRTNVLSSNGASGTIKNHMAWKALPRTPHLSSSSFVPPTGICANFRISSDALRTLKLLALPPKPILADCASPSTYIFTHDAISALLWCNIMRARRQANILDENAIVYAIFPVDCRARLGLPAPYCGNAVYTTRTVLPLRTLTQPIAMDEHESDPLQISGLQAAALDIRAALIQVTGDVFRDFLGFVEKNDSTMAMHMAGFEELGSSNMLLTSYFGFDHHGLDFGEVLGGRIEAFRIPSQGLLPGMQFLLPRLPDGGCEIVIFDSKEVVEALDADAIWKQMAVRQG
ncbi:MAG: hypothetical protein Q9157_000469 [Trypethelium eluteriae]